MAAKAACDRITPDARRVEKLRKRLRKFSRLANAIFSVACDENLTPIEASAIDELVQDLALSLAAVKGGVA